MVWLLPAAEANRVQVIVIVAYGVALGSFAHVIAGSIDVMHLAQVTASAGLAYSAASSSRRCSVTSLAARPSSLRSTSPRSLRSVWAGAQASGDGPQPGGPSAAGHECGSVNALRRGGRSALWHGQGHAPAAIAYSENASLLR